jgi:soluble lytic murein transglycosylase-like protein
LHLNYQRVVVSCCAIASRFILCQIKWFDMRCFAHSFWLATSLLLLACNASAAPIFVIKEPDGTIRFTSKAPPQGIQAEVFTGKGSSFAYYKDDLKNYHARYSFGGTVRLHDRYHAFITRIARAYGLPAELLKAVIHAESAFNPFAVSAKGAKGLMQIMPDRGRSLGVRNLFVPEENIEAGARHLAFLVRKYSGKLALALAAYNAGEGAVEKYGGIPPYAETQGYVRRVLRLKDRYEALGTKALIKSSSLG